MVELSKRDLEAIHDTHDTVIKIQTILGNGHEGLCHDVRCHQKRITRIELVLVGLVSSGVLSGGVIGLIRWIGG